MKYKLISYCEFDKYAAKSFCAIHNVTEDLNLGDITKVDEHKVPYFNVICGGSPCQDFSIAGKQNGASWTCRNCQHSYNPLTVHYTKRAICPKCSSDDLDKTRSSLLVEWLRMIRGNRPDWGIYENVKNIVGKKFIKTFQLFEQELHEYGYNTYWQVLNAKFFGVPQNRERVYLLLIKKELDNGQFSFPSPSPFFTCLNDILEEVVDEKYYLPIEKVKKLVRNMEKRGTLLYEPDEKALKEFEPELKLAGNFNEPGGYSHSGRVYFSDGCSPALVACGGGNQQPKIIYAGSISNSYLSGPVLSTFGISTTHLAGHEQIKIVEKADTTKNIKENTCHSLSAISSNDIILVRQGTRKGYIECFKGGLIKLSYPQNLNKRGRVLYHGMVCPTLLTSSDIFRIESLVRIRRLTPLECFRLMGFSDEDFEKAKAAGISNCQLYKQTGNSIVVNVLYHIFLKLYEAMPYLFDNVQLSSFFSGIGAFEKAFQYLADTVNR